MIHANFRKTRKYRQTKERLKGTHNLAPRENHYQLPGICIVSDVLSEEREKERLIDF